MNLIHDRVIGAGSSWGKKQSCVTAHRLSVQKLVKRWQWCNFGRNHTQEKTQTPSHFSFLDVIHVFILIPLFPAPPLALHVPSLFTTLHASTSKTAARPSAHPAATREMESGQTKQSNETTLLGKVHILRSNKHSLTVQ